MLAVVCFRELSDTLFTNFGRSLGEDVRQPELSRDIILPEVPCFFGARVTIRSSPVLNVASPRFSSHIHGIKSVYQ